MYDVHGILLRVRWSHTIKLQEHTVTIPRIKFPAICHFAFLLPKTICCAYFPVPMVLHV